MTSASEQSSDETVSYSEEEIMDVDDTNNNENEQAIDAMLEENERLEEQENAFLTAKRSGKQKASKSSSPVPGTPDMNVEMWRELKRLQSELNSLKRPRESDVCSNKKGESSTKRKKSEISVNNDVAFARQGSSMEVDFKIEGEGSKTQLSSAKFKQLSSANSKQLSSAKLSQLRSANTPQLSSAKSSQLSSANSTKTLPVPEQDEIVAIHDTADNDDPLRVETEEIQRGEDQEDDDGLSSDDEVEMEEDGQGLFADLVEGVNIEGDDDRPGPPLTQIWADKINLAWKTKINKVAYTHLLQKYKTASNLTACKVPSVNKSIWKPLNKWQKKADLNMTSCQRSLIAVVSAVLKTHDYFNTLPRATRQVAMQTTADIVSLLGKVNRELMTRRKMSARSVLVGDYKSLATTTEVTDDNLFGDNLTQDIKDVNLRRKMVDPHAYRPYRRDWRSNNRGAFNNSYNNYNSGSFLWRGRGRGRFPRASHSTRGHHHQSHHHKKQQ